ncbi:MAG: MotA/TolQ/ExbB proton channel family protein [Spirochaetales bacterium]|nr:MotA/TolQ/ExbB proton channel family protein [Spirochaetales bacterium]
MIDLFFKGGVLMFPLLGGSILVLTVVIERLIVFSQTGIRQDFLKALKQRLSPSPDNHTSQVVIRHKGWLENLILDIERMKDSTREVLEKHISKKGDEYLLNLEKHLHLLELTGRMAPMLGLLGTVMGMVEAFKQVALVKTVVDPSILAGGIWEALITTVFGLIVGIPALIAYHFFTTRLKRIAFYLKRECEEIISFAKGKDD